MRMLSIQHALEHHLVAPVLDLIPLDVNLVIAQPPRIKVPGKLAGDDNFSGPRGEGARERGAVGVWGRSGGGIGGDGVILHEKVCVLRRVAGWEFVDKAGGIYSQWFLYYFRVSNGGPMHVAEGVVVPHGGKELTFVELS